MHNVRICCPYFSENSYWVEKPENNKERNEGEGSGQEFLGGGILWKWNVSDRDCNIS